jgi:hypothetical protein
MQKTNHSLSTDTIVLKCVHIAPGRYSSLVRATTTDFLLPGGDFKNMENQETHKFPQNPPLDLKIPISWGRLDLLSDKLEI